MSAPWLKFYPTDWRADPALRMCSIAARGLWMEMLCVMHEAEPRGSLLVNGRPVNERQLAGLVGCSLDEVSGLLGELEDAGVFSREDGVIFSRRMRRDDERADRDKANGRRGGNPLLKGVNPHGEGGGYPPTSSGDKAQKPEARDQISDADASDASARSADVRPPARDMDGDAHSGFDQRDFQRFWDLYPHRVGKQDALKAFLAIGKRSAVTLDAMLRALDRYIRTKPPDRAWCNPATWLRQGRWDDEPSIDDGFRTAAGGTSRRASGAGKLIAAMGDLLHERADAGPAAASSRAAGAEPGAAPGRAGDVLPFGRSFGPGIR